MSRRLSIARLLRPYWPLLLIAFIAMLLEGGAALLEAQRRALDLHRQLQGPRAGRLRRSHGHRLAALDHAHLAPPQVAAGGLQRDGERGVVTEKARGLRDGLDAGNRLAPREVRRGAHDRDEQEQHQEHPGLRPGPLRHDEDHSRGPLQTRSVA